jgi:hypothetical protein
VNGLARFEESSQVASAMVTGSTPGIGAICGQFRQHNVPAFGPRCIGGGDE